MKYLVVGLGNPGAEYQNNRHNIGFMALDELAASKEKTFSSGRYGYTTTLRHKGRTLILLKPSTFMNLSGKAVRYHLTQNKIPVSNLLVITDDLALPFGKIRIRPKGSHGGHNGLRNIQEVMGNDVYARLRFGVGSDFNKGGQVDYVLADFPSDEMDALDATYLPKMAKAGLAFATMTVDQVMSSFNG
ncbi:UNVERIFIED_CONTAM: hypothetical protein GTU68_012458 [Idotea baltica]|nr:hypothetical protein [Idotea baltica]